MYDQDCFGGIFHSRAIDRVGNYLIGCRKELEVRFNLGGRAHSEGRVCFT